MSLIIIIATIWGISALIRSAREKKAREKAQRIASEQARINREMREMKQKASEEVAARIALEREQMRQRREQERLSAEQAKQAEQIAKHDEEIRKLKQTVNRLSTKVNDIDLRIIDLESVKEMNYKKFLEADHAGDDTNKEKYLRKLITIDNQLSSARDSRQAALDKIENAQRKMSA